VNAAAGWALATLAVVAGGWAYGWQGTVVALTLVVFWLLLQFSRALRAMRTAAGRPVGFVDNAVMLQARLRTGMRLIDIIGLTRSLGQELGDDIAPDRERYAWRDAAGDAVIVELAAGRCTGWRLERAAGPMD
jgi:glucose-6-phosphate-specific signal transduction histidine kinase